MTDRVYWDDDEKRKLVDAVFVMRQNDPDSSLISIINRAQAQLPKDRQRNIPSVKAIPWISDALKLRFRGLRDKARALDNAKTEATSAKQGQSQLKDRLNELVTKAREEAISKMSIEDLVVELASRMAINQQEVIDRIEALERRAPAPPRVDLSDPSIGPTGSKKTILVVGMLPEQENNLRAKFKGRVDLRFMRGNDVKSTLPYAGHIILNGKFIAHKTQSRVKSLAGGARVIIVHGGQSAVANKIEEII